MSIKKKNVKIACVLDDFSYECLKHECSVVRLESGNWLEKLQSEKPDLLLAESAWNRNFKELFSYPVMAGKTPDIISWCRARSVPTVFWNKDDPVHFYTFIKVVRYFDHIFTADSGCIEKYKALLNHERVHHLHMAAQPKLHNPLGRTLHKTGNTVFSGTWYALRKGRVAEMERMLDAAAKYGLDIYDRKSNYKEHGYYRYPEKYRGFVKGFLPYEQMAEAYKRYNVVLNVNTVSDSNTMFSRRIFEALACGVCAVSSYSPAVENTFPGIVKLCKSSEEVERNLELLIKNEDLRDRLALLGIRAIFKGHTYSDRLEAMLEKIGISRPSEAEAPVSVITCTNKQGFMENILQNFMRQEYGNKELIVVLNNNAVIEREWLDRTSGHGNIRVLRMDESKTLGECLNFAVEQAKGSFIAKFDDDDYYAPFYLTDMIDCFKYADAEIVGKYSYYCYLEDLGILALRFKGLEYRYTDFLSGATMVAKKEVFDSVRFDSLPSGTDTQFYRACDAKGIRLYSSDRFNYACFRSSKAGLHTWKMDCGEFLKKCAVVEYKGSYKEHVTV